MKIFNPISYEEKHFPRMQQCLNNPLHLILQQYNLGLLGKHVGSELYFFQLENELQQIPYFSRKINTTLTSLANSNIIDVSQSIHIKWTDIYHFIKFGFFPIIFVDLYYIPFSHHYKETHGIHSLCLTGIDLDLDIVFIFDHSFKLSNSPVDIKEIDEAWERDGNKCLIISKGKEINKSAISTEQLLLNSKQMIFGFDQIPKNLNSEEFNIARNSYNTPGIEKINLLHLYYNRLEFDDKYKLTASRFASVLYYIVEQNELHFEFLNSLSETAPCHIYNELNLLFTDICNTWYYLRNMTLRLSVDRKTIYIELCHEYLDKIMNLENNYSHYILFNL